MSRMLVITDKGASQDRVPSGVQKVLSHWRGLDRPNVSVIALDRVLEDASVLDDVESVWLLLDDPAAGDLFAITGECE
ncbi:MAG: hypothetical protein AAF085_12630, partial [Planctomycetota bacterium]